MAFGVRKKLFDFFLGCCHLFVLGPLDILELACPQLEALTPGICLDNKSPTELLSMLNSINDRDG